MLSNFWKVLILILLFSINLYGGQVGGIVTNLGAGATQGVSSPATSSAPMSSGGKTGTILQKALQQESNLKSESNQSLQGQESNSESLEGLENLNIGEYPQELLGELQKRKKELIKSSKQAIQVSSLEKSFTNRIKNLRSHLRQFGYNFFRGKPRISFSIPVDKNYILGPGDELYIYIIGAPIDSNLSKINRLIVDREGKVYLPGIGVFYVWGLSLGETEKIISKALNANIKLTVGKLRTFPVYVSGEVNRPGAVIATAINTVIDAIMMAGGIKKTGTLRDVIVTRKINNHVKKYHIDFYKLLLKGEQIDFRLKDGDVIFVKPIGKTAGIIGKVKRPAIYEFKGKITVNDLIKLAGGLLPSSYKLKVSLQRYKKNLYLEVEEGTLDNKSFMNQTIKDGDIISIKEVINIPQNAVEISGYTPYPGLYEYKNGMRLSQLLTDDLFFQDSNLNFAIILRQFPPGALPKFITFSPNDILEKKNDLLLFPTDKIYLFKYNFLNINLNKVKNVVILKGYLKYPSLFAYKRGLKLSNIFNRDQLKVDTNMKFGVIFRRFPFGEPPKYLTFAPEDILNKRKDINLMPADTVIFYKFGERNIDFDKIKDVVVVEGETLYPGVYAFKKNMKLSDIINSDILTLNTDLNYGEIERRDLKTFKIINILKFSPSDVLNGKMNINLQKLDVIRLFPRHVFAPIKITGKVKQPLILPYHFGLKLVDALSKAEFLDDLKNLKVEIFREVSKKKSLSLIQKAENIKGKAESRGELIKKNVASIFLYDLLLAKNPKLNISLNPGDRLLIKKIEKDEVVEKVQVKGYVKRPGVYSITDKTTLYDILKKAGGFRENAYPEGIIFTRESVKEMQKERLNRAILEMKQEVEKEQAGVMQSDLEPSQKNARMEAMQAKRRLLDLMQKTEVNGRISGLIIPHDLEKLKNSVSNIYLMNGDTIFIPKKPGSVMVFGEVYNPTALVRIKDYKVKDYISDAGGLTRDADKENIFIIKANGAVVTSSNMYKGRFWEGRNPKIWGIPFLFSKNIMNYKLDPGDAVIVPLKVKIPIFWRPLMRDVIQIIYQSTLTAYTVKHLND